MVKELNGKELQGFIKERQLRQVRNLRQQFHIVPKLLIIKSPSAGAVIDTYVRMKVRYAADIFIEVLVETVEETAMIERIKAANADDSIQGVIVQLPLENRKKTDEICQTIRPEKDVDGLGTSETYPSATAQAIDWLLNGYNVELAGKDIVIVGNGKLVGRPLNQMWQSRGLNVVVVDKDSSDPKKVISGADVIVTATGVPHLIKRDWVKPGAVVVDAGTASEGGVVVGDVDDDVRQRQDITITPIKGGVGPLTYTVLFDHLIEACLRRAGQLG